jgi:hypothetical protein
VGVGVGVVTGMGVVDGMSPSQYSFHERVAQSNSSSS